MKASTKKAPAKKKFVFKKSNHIKLSTTSKLDVSLWDCPHALRARSRVRFAKFAMRTLVLLVLRMSVPYCTTILT